MSSREGASSRPTALSRATADWPLRRASACRATCTANPRSAAPDTTWAELLSGGFEPGLENLTYLARAITPPARPRRYDTRFFIVDAGRVAHRAAQSDGELLDIGWFTVEAAKSLKLPSITRHIMDDLAAHLALAPARRRQEPVPFYAHRHGVFERRLLTRP